MPVIFHLRLKVFSAWLHPDNFSHGGQCHRPWYLVGMILQLKWHDLLKASRWSKRQQTFVTWSSQPLIEWWLKDPSTFWRLVLHGILAGKNPPPHRLSYLTMCHDTFMGISVSYENLHQKWHYVRYYLDIVSNRLEMYDLGIISTFSTLRR